MKDDNLIYTGQLTYKEIDFTFVFDGKMLRLLPPKEKRLEIENDWLANYIAEGVYTSNIPTIETNCLSGVCNGSGKNIVFLVKCGSYLGGCSSALTVDVVAYIVCQYGCTLIDRICFTAPEIDAIHPLNKAFNISLGGGLKAFKQTGVLSITTKDFESTTTDMQEFIVDDKKVAVNFSVWRGVNMSIGETPLSLNSCLIFTFEPTEDYEFILRLWHIAKDFLSFLCYRRDVHLPIIELSAPDVNNKHREFATLSIVGEDGRTSMKDIQKGRYIRQELIAGHEGQILTDIASGELYLRHLPESYDSGRHKDAAKFVMITAAFEWEFRRNYPAGIKKSDTTRKAEEDAANKLQELVDNSSGKLKSIYKFLKRLTKSDSLQSEIGQVGKDYSEIIDLFGNNLYSRHGESLDYSKMGKRLSDQRNHFAHGDLDQEFINLSLLDLICLEYIVYTMQLKHYAIDALKIQNAINDLFYCGVSLPEK